MGVLLNKAAVFLGLHSVSDRWINGGGKRGNGSTLTGRKLGPSATLTTTNIIRTGLSLIAGPRIRRLTPCTKTQPIFFLRKLFPKSPNAKWTTVQNILTGKQILLPPSTFASSDVNSTSYIILTESRYLQASSFRILQTCKSTKCHPSLLHLTHNKIGNGRTVQRNTKVPSNLWSWTLLRWSHHSIHCGHTFLGASAYSQKASFTFVLPVRPSLFLSFRMCQNRSH
jgi:hypothetical protein